MQCGLTCLRMICRYFGKDYSTELISKYCFATNEGVSLLGIRDAAVTLGLEAVAAKLRLEDYPNTCYPSPIPITNKFWDFIEHAIPNCHTRYDVLRQSEL